MGVLEYLTKPAESINFKVVSWMYFACCCLCGFFYCLETYLKTLDKDNWAYDNLDQIKGIYVIFVPFIPTLMWSLWMARLQSTAQENKKKD
ncbi:hypothetical protein TrCOL_g2485 [Triparma columacea]|uniref:Uncharacterized protein n=1 Tax=Triparma columacea TaxID=722753 RepID=A0A9W7GMU0_9STRA|nr:hypothetical protein TrCOL_g2485 [Triparma columacea]